MWVGVSFFLENVNFDGLIVTSVKNTSDGGDHTFSKKLYKPHHPTLQCRRRLVRTPPARGGHQLTGATLGLLLRSYPVDDVHLAGITPSICFWGLDSIEHGLHSIAYIAYGHRAPVDGAMGHESQG